MNVVMWCNRIIRFGFVLTIGLVPLLLTPWNYELFEYNKMMAVYGLTVLVTAAWIIKSIREKQFRIPKTPLDIPIALFVGSQLVSTVFSMDPHVSWFGYYSRFNGGLWSIISYTLLYYVFVSSMRGADTSNGTSRTGTLDAIQRMVRLSLITGILIAVYGVLERLGIDKSLWVQDVQNRVFSTLGQPNWLAAYLAILIPLAISFAVGTFPRYGKTAYYVAAGVLFFVTLLFTRSRSGLLGFAMADLLFWMFVAARIGMSKIRSSRLFVPALVLHGMFFLIVTIHGTSIPQLDRFVTVNGLLSSARSAVSTTSKKLEATPSGSQTSVTGPALEVGGTESGTIRKYVWQAAIAAWRSSPKTLLIGTGTETFAFAFYKFRPIGHNMTSEWDFLYNKAHNEYLNYLATTGFFGLGSYLILLGAYVFWFVQTVKHERHEETYTLATALFSGWMSVLITNFFGFSVVVTQVFLFVIPAITFVLLVSKTKDRVFELSDTPAYLTFLPVIIKTRFLAVLTGGVFVTAIMLISGVGSFWYADTLYAKGYRLSRAGLYGQSIPAVTQAVKINRSEPLYHDELSGSYATLAVAAFENGNATQAAQLATIAIDENLRSLAVSPQNINFLKTQTKIYYTLSSINPTFNAKAVEALQKAVAFSPNDPKIFYNLAILVGRDGKADQAIEYLLKSKSLKPNYRDAYYALWVFYTEGKKTKEARDILTEYLTKIDPNDADFQDKLK